MDKGKSFTPMDPNLQVTNIKEVNEHIFKGGVIVILCDVNLQCILLRLNLYLIINPEYIVVYQDLKLLKLLIIHA